jgi:hypothetical protein
MHKPGVDECDADREDVDVEKEELEEDGNLDFGHEDELQDAFKPEPIQMIESPVDGMPIPADEQPSTQLNLAPSFSYDNCVCVADDREYVELFADELVGRGWAYKGKNLIEGKAYSEKEFNDEAEGWCPPGCDQYRYWVNVWLAVGLRWKADGQPKNRRRWPRDQVLWLYGHPFVRNTDGPTERVRSWLIPVRPKREKCVHYRRQVFAKRGIEQGEFGHYDLYRNCVARRSVGGAFLTVKDEAVYACEYRNPPDEASVAEHLDKYDDERLRAGPPEEVPLFGIT